MKEIKLCKDCVNFCSHTKDIWHCDYEYWSETEIVLALLNCPEMFECEHFELIK